MSSGYADIDDSVATQTPYEVKYGAGTWPGTGTTLRPYSRDQLFPSFAGSETDLYLTGNGTAASGVQLSKSLHRWGSGKWSINAASGVQIQPPDGCVMEGGRLYHSGTLQILTSTTLAINLYNMFLSLSTVNIYVLCGTTLTINEKGCSLFAGVITMVPYGPPTAGVLAWNKTDSTHVSSAAIDVLGHFGCCNPYNGIVNLTCNNVATNRTGSADLVNALGIPTLNKIQYSWNYSAIPAFGSADSSFYNETLGTAILSDPPSGSTGKPNPGNSPYTDYTPDAWGHTRTGIGAFNFGGTAPSITTQPSAQSINVGDNATFTITASGSATLAYQWKCNGASIANGAQYSGALSASLAVLAAPLALDQSLYSCVVTNSVGSATSSTAKLAVFGSPYRFDAQKLVLEQFRGGNA